MKFVSHSEKNTINFAKKLARKLRGGDVLGLIGDLGTGKTIFVKGLAKALGIKDAIHSPTFVLMHIHAINPKSEIRNPKQILNSKIQNSKQKLKSYNLNLPTVLCHIDAYRLDNTNDLLEIGADEYIGNPEVITAIEWAEKVYPAPRRAQGLPPGWSLRAGSRSAPKNIKYIHFKHHPKNENWRIIEY